MKAPAGIETTRLSLLQPQAVKCIVKRAIASTRI
jgi:hypothetical protein